MKNILLILVAAGAAISITACGGGGGGGGAEAGSTPTNQLFKADMVKLGGTGVTGFSKANAMIDNSFTKVFGGSTSADVKAFIDARVKHVYAVSEIQAMTAEIVFKNGQKQTRVLKDLFSNSGDPEVNPNSGSQLAGVNFGGGLAIMQHINDVKLLVNLPTGQVESNTSRIGIIGLTGGYSNLKDQNGNDIAVPLEGRISVLVHEGRHSDCPDSFDASNCGYPHRICPRGHALAGEAACDNSAWGPYAMGAIYLSSTQDNYKINTLDYRVMDAMVNDNFSRVDPKDLAEMKVTSPDLNSL